MQSPLILLIDDSATIRKLVEHHLTGAGYRVVFAVDAETGLELAASQLPDLIILDHQLPGVTGDHVCHVLLESEATARIPILVSSSLRSRAFVHYSDFPNVIDQLPKPFTADLLRSGVDNALQNGAMVIQAQWNGSAMPESVEPDNETLLEGNLRAIPLNSLFQFLTASRLTGRLVVESGAERIKFAIASGKIQAVYSATIDPERLIEQLPEELREFAPMIPFSLAEQRNESMSGLLKLFESTLSHATRLKALLRFQSSLLTHYALQGEPRAFSFDSYKSLPPLFQAFPLQVSLAALLIEGVFHSTHPEDLNGAAPLVFGRPRHRLVAIDRSGLRPLEAAVDSGINGKRALSEIAERLEMPVEQVAAVALGLELAGHVERVSPVVATNVLLLDANPETAATLNSLNHAENGRFQIREVRDRIAARLLLKRLPFSLIIMPINDSDDESYFHALKAIARPESRFLGIVDSDGEDEYRLAALRDLGIDTIAKRPISETRLLGLMIESLQPSVAFYA